MSNSRARLVRVLGRYDVPEDGGEFDTLPVDDVPTLEPDAFRAAAGDAAGRAAGDVAGRAAGDVAGPAALRPGAAGPGSGVRAVSLDAWRAAVRERISSPETAPKPHWNRAELAGRVAELCGGRAPAAYTFAVQLVLDSQQQGEPVAWITTRDHAFYPPDAAANGVDLAALVVVRTPGGEHVPRAADQLGRSGAFGLLILDLGAEARVPAPLLSRLLGLAQKHDMAVVCLTMKSSDSPSLDSLVALRADAGRTRQSPGRFACTLRVAKDKRHAPGWGETVLCRGPAGVQ